MKLYLGIIGGFCILYYFFAVAYTRRWKSTFILFWPTAGAVHLLLLAFWTMFPVGMQRTIEVCFVVFWMIFLIEEYRIFRTIRYWRKHETEIDAAYLIVLGAQVRGTKITNSLYRRLKAAEEYLKLHPLANVVVSGGRGRGEDVTEAEAMHGYLLQHGITEERIRKEEESTSTRLNFRYSSEMIGDTQQQIAVVTNDFHLYRALRIAEMEGYHSVSGIVAGSNPALYLNYIVREFFALIWMQWKAWTE